MNTLIPTRPVAPAAGYIGGKRNLASRLVAMIERIEHDGYAEPFVGMGGIFLRRRSRPKIEVINDYRATSPRSFASCRGTMPISSTCCASGSPAGPNSSG